MRFSWKGKLAKSWRWNAVAAADSCGWSAMMLPESSSSLKEMAESSAVCVPAPPLLPWPSSTDVALRSSIDVACPAAPPA